MSDLLLSKLMYIETIAKFCILRPHHNSVYDNEQSSRPRQYQDFKQPLCTKNCHAGKESAIQAVPCSTAAPLSVHLNSIWAKDNEGNSQEKHNLELQALQGPVIFRTV